MTNDEFVQVAMRNIAEKRQKAVTVARNYRDKIHAKLPQLENIKDEINTLCVKAATLSLEGANKEDIDSLYNKAQSLENKYNEIIKEENINYNKMEPQYSCGECSDTGYVSGKLCNCTKSIIAELKRQQVIETSPLSLCSFDTFDLGKYSEEKMANSPVSAREQMHGIFSYCKQYADNFSLSNKSIYMCGHAGLGKTHLALSMANKVLTLGYNVVYVSAQDAFDKMEKERFGQPGDTLRTLESADLLILDDLGTEFITPYVGSCLYSIINNRCTKKPTIITSNIVNDADLRRRYTEKVVSRLIGSCDVLTFIGDDIRLLGQV